MFTSSRRSTLTHSASAVALAFAPHTFPTGPGSCPEPLSFLTAVHTVPFPALFTPSGPSQPTSGSSATARASSHAPHTHPTAPTLWACSSQMLVWPLSSFSQVLSPCPPLTLTKLFPAHYALRPQGCTAARVALPAQPWLLHDPQASSPGLLLPGSFPGHTDKRLPLSRPQPSPVLYEAHPCTRPC